ncbi:hypothetical protein [Nocardia sp. GP40]|uniref:hypothetical protein n=1 Tax=Nocardia sp. GP40 TaxID=3156268 RepID=UPI003D191CDA
MAESFIAAELEPRTPPPIATTASRRRLSAFADDPPDDVGVLALRIIPLTAERQAVASAGFWTARSARSSGTPEWLRWW